MSRYLFTSESVTEGHPDKVCDRISDSVLDAIIANDPNARVACETTATTGVVSVMGEITTNSYADIPGIVRKALRDIGYTSECGFDADTCAVVTSIDEQSPDIAMGVDKSLEDKSDSENIGGGAGDQGIMFGFACDETPELMPLAISLAHKLAKRLTAVRKSGVLPYLFPDGKTQVTVEYVDGKPSRIDTVVVSSQHTEDVSLDTLREGIIENVIRPTIPADLIDEKTRIFINPTGRFVVGGPVGDSGLTGRKIIVDTYGGYARHGGGAFSGKDPTKVDRSASYAARREERSKIRTRLQVRNRACLRHRRRASRFRLCRHLRHRNDTGREDLRDHLQGIRLHSGRHNQDARPAQADLRAARRLRPYGPRGPRSTLGRHRQGR